MAGNDPLVAEYNERDSAKTGALIWRDRVLGIQEFRNSAGLILTAATTPIIAQPTITNTAGGVTTTVNVIRWAAGVANAITFTFDVPGDYNESIDKLHLRLKLWKSTAGNTAAVNMNGVMGGVRNAVDITSAATIVTATPVAISDAVTPSVLDLNFSGNSLKGKDSLGFTINPDAHDTCVIDLYGGSMRYAGGLSLWSESDRYTA